MVRALINAQVVPLGYPAVGLGGVPNISIIQGSSDISMHTFGWTECSISAATGELTVTTWGIDPYTQAGLVADAATIIARQPAVVSEFKVLPL